MEQAVEFTSSSSDLIKKSVSYQMMNRNPEAIQNTLENLAESDNIKIIRIFDMMGRISYSSRPKEMDAGADLSMCSMCHYSHSRSSETLSEKRNWLILKEGKSEYLVFSEPVYNEPSCFTADCHFHPRDQRLLGRVEGTSTLNISKVNLRGNRANQYGGGIYVTGGASTTTLTNSNVTGNSADGQNYSRGGGLYDNGGIVLIYNCTVSGNYATSTTTSGNGFYASGTDDVVRNSIFWGNTGGTAEQITGSPTVTYTDVQGGFAGTGNINSDPIFVAPAQASSGNPTTSGDFHICYASGSPAGCTSGPSPCIDTGNTYTGVPGDDIDSNTRPYDVPGIDDGTNDYDMGADEYVP